MTGVEDIVWDIRMKNRENQGECLDSEDPRQTM